MFLNEQEVFSFFSNWEIYLSVVSIDVHICVPCFQDVVLSMKMTDSSHIIVFFGIWVILKSYDNRLIGKLRIIYKRTCFYTIFLNEF